MENQNTAQGQPQGEAQMFHGEPCLCRALAAHLLTAFGMKSEAARQHMRNARIEVLKAVRTAIDERIECLSRANQQKGTHVTVE